jgi:YHS domain-containing protein
MRYELCARVCVYGPLICQGAEYDAISDAIQMKVIDPVAGKRIGNSKFKPQDVLNALYFLTEQCHISWDASHE